MSDFPKKLLDQLIDNLDVAVFFADPEGVVRYLNEPAAYTIRLPRLTALGRHLDRILPVEVAQFLTAEGREALATGINRRTKGKTFILPGRGLLFFDIQVSPYRLPDEGSWIAYLLNDVTARERRKMATEQAKENAEAEARARRSFLARMSHEIRTPMNGIIGMTDLAMNSDDREETEEYLEVIRNASDSLLGIINDVLDYAKIESGRLEPESIPFNPRSLLDEVLALLGPAADEKQIQLYSSVEEGMADRLLGDPVRIRQVLTNLMGNALKFTESGSVKVSLHLEQPTDGISGRRLVLAGSVEDTGIGIEPERLEQLFEPFIQNDSATTREFGGTGLGLAISRNLARLMGGDVEASSVPGEGSVFRFRIKVEEPEAEVSQQKTGKTEPADKDYRWNGEVVLLAEDNRVNRIVAEKLLRRVGLDVLCCENGREAVEAYRDKLPSAVLMDLEMPIMDGGEATREIRRDEIRAGRSRVPVIALTAHVLEEERRDAEEAGLDGWVAKPVKPAELYAELARLLPPVVSGR